MINIFKHSMPQPARQHLSGMTKSIYRFARAGLVESWRQGCRRSRSEKRRTTIQGSSVSSAGSSSPSSVDEQTMPVSARSSTPSITNMFQNWKAENEVLVSFPKVDNLVINYMLRGKSSLSFAPSCRSKKQKQPSNVRPHCA